MVAARRTLVAALTGGLLAISGCFASRVPRLVPGSDLALPESRRTRLIRDVLGCPAPRQAPPLAARPDSTRRIPDAACGETNGPTPATPVNVQKRP